MDVKKIVSKYLNEAVKSPIGGLVEKWSVEYPAFGALDPTMKMDYADYIVKFHSSIKRKISIKDPTVYNFLKRHDGKHGTKLITLEQLKDVTAVPIQDLINFLNFYGGFKKLELGDDVASAGYVDDDEFKLTKIFNTSGLNPTNRKVEVSKAMWYSDENAIINDGGFRVYEIKNQTQAVRMGYYYQELHDKQNSLLKSLRLHTTAPWNVTLRKGYEHSGSTNYRHGYNKWESFREARGFSFYFIIDDSIDPTTDILKTGKWHMASLQVTDYGGYQIESILNDGEIPLPWKKLVAKFPKLEPYRKLLQYHKFSEDELSEPTPGEPEIIIYNENPDSERYIGRQLPEIQIEYFKAGNDVTRVETWRTMTFEVRKAYIDTITRTNLIQKISNVELLKAITSSKGGINELLEDKLKSIGYDGVSHLMHHYIGLSYDVDYIGKKKSYFVVYKNKINQKYGLFNSKKGVWVKSKVTLYDDRFEINKSECGSQKGSDGKRYKWIAFVASNGDRFYIVNDDFFGSLESMHIGYFFRAETWDLLKEQLFEDPTKFKPKGSIGEHEDI